MIFLWDYYGIFYGISLWFPMLFPCYIYDLSMRFLWDSYGISMIKGSWEAILPSYGQILRLEMMKGGMSSNNI